MRRPLSHLICRELLVRIACRAGFPGKLAVVEFDF
jgi:hypothetical protein